MSPTYYALALAATLFVAALAIAVLAVLARAAPRARFANTNARGLCEYAVNCQTAPRPTRCGMAATWAGPSMTRLTAEQVAHATQA